MKFTLQTLLSFFLTFVISTSNTFGAKDPLKFMVPCNLKKTKEYAKVERKPILIYIHSTKCSSSRTFTRQIIGQSSFSNWADKNFICMEANILNTRGKEIAKKYGVLKIPAIIMLSYDQDLEYAVDMKLDSVSLYNQFRSFLSANSLKSQIELLRETNGLSYNDASKAIAASYAKADFKKNPGSSAELMAFERTLKIGKLSDLHNAYIIEYKKLTGNISKNTSSQVATN